MATAKRKRASTSSSTQRRKKNKGAGGKKLAFYIALLAIGAGAIVFYDRYVSVSPSLLPGHAQKSVSGKSAQKNAFVEPDYQFYTLLPQGNGTQKTAAVAALAVKPVAAPAAKPIAAPAAKPTAEPKPIAAPKPATVAPKTTTTAPIIAAKPTAIVAPPKHKYIVQLASFKQYQDADQLKAKLILQGYSTRVSSAAINGVVWYRLSIGPYTSTAQAKTAQTQLEQTHLVSHTQVVEQ